MKRLVQAAAVLGVVAMVPLLASAAVSRRWTKPAERLPQVQVALVPGAYIKVDGSPGPHLAARLELALELWRAGRVRAIVASGGFPPGGRSEPQSMLVWLTEHGVPADKIIVDAHGNSTYESVRRAQQVFGIESMIICSQNYTLPRAVVTARWLGLDAWGLADETVLRDHPRTSRRGIVREFGATFKMLYDVIARPSVRTDALVAPLFER
ncbi:MAG: SanA/YdcF family protein [Propionibacteriaceae bacterium]